MRIAPLVLCLLATVSCVEASAPITHRSKKTSDKTQSDDATEDESETSSDDDDDENPADPASPPRGGIEQFPGSKLFMPPKTPAPAIVMLHGSEGGTEPFIGEVATAVASKGFVVLALCWFCLLYTSRCV